MHKFTRNILLLLSVAITATGYSFAQQLSDYDVDPLTGYRMERYRAPVPADMPGGVTLDISTALNHHAKGELLFVDVYPPKGLGPDPLDGHWVTNEIRESIPGAIWLPEVGRGFLEADAIDYFRRNLIRLSGDKLDAPIAFFCTSDCWQSWNASRRAIEMGYSNIHWFPLGSDGWLEAGNELSVVQAVNFLDDTTPVLEPGQSDISTLTKERSDPQALFPESGRISLINQQGEELDIGEVTFTKVDKDAVRVEVELESPAFIDQFLSMRPFKCITEPTEWFCYLNYPYELHKLINADDMTELEYQLMFIWKSPRMHGIDAWNGVYYKLTAQADGTFIGKLLQGDLNVLASPPEPYSHPIDLNEFIEEDAKNRLFPSLIIRP